jgi:hypothetical protein
MVRIVSKQFFRIFLVLLAASSLESSVWAYSRVSNQDCSSNCEAVTAPTIHKQLATSVDIKTAGADATNPTSLPQSASVSASGDAHAATLRSTSSNPDEEPNKALAAANSGSEGGSNPGPILFLLIGLSLIGVRLVVSYRSRKARNLAAETH